MRSPSSPPARRLVCALAATAHLSGCYLLAPPPSSSYYEHYRPPQWSRAFGYLSAGPVAHASFFGNVDDLEPGSGFTITVPPLFPAAVALYAFALAASLDGYYVDLDPGELPEASVSGVTDPSRLYISDFSIDLSYSHTGHDDRRGGGLDYHALLVGLRLGGPRRYVPRYYLCGGFGWYWFDYDVRPDASVGGPYWGLGLEFFPEKELSLGLEYKMHFYFGEDDAGVPVDGGARQLALLLSLYW